MSDQDGDQAYPNKRAVRLIDGPLAGHLVEAPARVGPPHHLLVLRADPTRVRSATNPPGDTRGWLLYASRGVAKVGAEWEFTYRSTLDETDADTPDLHARS